MRQRNTDLLSEADSRAVITEINSWCRRTGTNYNKLIVAARVAPSTRSAVRNRKRRITHETAKRLREAMRRHQHGIGKAEHKQRVSKIRAEKFKPAPTLVRVDRTPCFKCGIPADKGCEHSRFQRQMYSR